MKRTYPLQVRFSSYGHWKITTEHYGKEITCTTNNSLAVDDYKDDNNRRSNQGYDKLRAECIRVNKS
jgi:hypothetical protein